MRRIGGHLAVGRHGGGVVTPRPVSAATCTVNGWTVHADAPAWAGLDLSDVIPNGGRCLSVAWCHPDDADGDGVRYRVRPRDDRDRFEFRDGQWWVVR